jgi:hypothetical protein
MWGEEKMRLRVRKAIIGVARRTSAAARAHETRRRINVFL